MAYDSMISNGSNDTSLLTQPQAKAMHSLCKQFLKSKIFRGYYEERRYVEIINDYRDVIALQREETELQKQLLDIRQQLYFFFQENPKLWIGITNKALDSEKNSKFALNTYIWTELHELAYGEYWFNIKSVRFRETEIILKIKVVRPVTTTTSLSLTKQLMPTLLKAGNPVEAHAATNTTGTSINNTITTEPQIGFQDFIDVLKGWGTSTKYAIYDFMSNDISRENLTEFVKFIGLLVASLLVCALGAIKYLGTFTLHFMFEISRLTHALTPVIITIIEVFNKIVGGFYILLAMIWKDSTNKRQPAMQQIGFDPTYDRPMYRSIKYNVRSQASSWEHQQAKKLN